MHRAQLARVELSPDIQDVNRGNSRHRRGGYSCELGDLCHSHRHESHSIPIATKAASIGMERFIMDDGWFGQRKNDHAGLGDWNVNTEKLPNGLKPLIDKVHSLGMNFGLWVEPEMVNPDSVLYSGEEHSPGISKDRSHRETDQLAQLPSFAGDEFALTRS